MQSKETLPVNFENTETAFRDQSNASLKQAYQLFKVMNNRRLVNIGKHLVNFAFAVHFPIEGIIRNTIYKHFVGGVSIEDCSKTITRLARYNVDSILDYAQEGEESEDAFNATCREVIRTVEFAGNHKNVPFSVFKITGVARFDLLAKVSEQQPLTDEERAEFRSVEERVDAIFRRGFELDVPVLIDAEETWIQPVLDDMVMNLMSRYNKEKAIVQNTYQMYRHDSIERIKQHHRMALEGGFKFGLKIVRGAYMEKERNRAAERGYPSPIQPDKPATDRDFDDITRYFIEHLDSIDFMVATHNEESSLLLARLIDEYNLPRNHRGIYFSQLYGMSDHITYNLAEQGYNVAKYVPYGAVKTMMPYLFRRAEENSSVKGQTNRELKMIRTEIKRRRN
ncbi:L-proline dehydrogenase [Porphyromonadaceae bacterium NLAE-zl-C104]|uniref:proline dehydrogenase family protein n=1 Tax=Proteiniphilum sp. TaxID=1926877 RepID=UPI0008973F7A|nr:proline dehydrogenase family protein [Proteiniphilum sp.]MDY9919274.1 proline dehydrogenase family protein [Proteiniphilum sp.]SEA12212.1 L-proline dehydrogenase [Porphyromonadaceae bacterium KH3R12]SFS91754.1 L-proline dehydrogenase [Porphyromonadaceae bacterium NLAE-zl-C104]